MANGRAVDREDPENSRRNAARILDWGPISELHQGQRSYAPHRRAGHMTAPDHFASAASKSLARGGRSLIVASLSIATCFLCLPDGVTVLSAVGNVRRNIWFEAQALQCPQRARTKPSGPTASLAVILYPRPVGNSSTVKGGGPCWGS